MFDPYDRVTNMANSVATAITRQYPQQSIDARMDALIATLRTEQRSK